MINIAYLQDPGHGWFEVPMELIKSLNIAHKISAYSYLSRDGSIAYLEEDCDASVFHNAMKARGLEYKLKENHCNGDSFIRRLPGWQKVAPLFAADDLPPIPVGIGGTLALF